MEADVHRNAKASRTAWEKRRRAHRGPLCTARCGYYLDRALADAGITVHPTCDLPEDQAAALRAIAVPVVGHPLIPRQETPT